MDFFWGGIPLFFRLIQRCLWQRVFESERGLDLTNPDDAAILNAVYKRSSIFLPHRSDLTLRFAEQILKGEEK